MLLRFEVSNHRSIMEPVELSMIAVDGDRPSTRGFERLHERVLTTAGIYGPNASGKSNLLDAIDWLSSAVRHSMRAWSENVPREPHKFRDGPAQPSTYELDMVIDGIRFTYRVEVDAQAVLFEGLYSYPERRRRVLFERENLDITFRRGLGNLVGSRELLTPITLALPAVMRFDVSEIRDFGRALRDINVLGTRIYSLRAPIGRSFSTVEMFTGESRAARASALAMLRFADLGIEEVELVDAHASDQSLIWPIQPVRFVHRLAEQQIHFDLADESHGTRTWFALIGPVLSALQTGRIVLFDEIDASLHPRLSARLLELFQDPQTNRLGAQLIFTSHDTSLLNSLNRDEVWLTEKNDKASTTLTALAEYGGDKVRRSLNLERAYLQGRFGAVPELDQATLRSALGLNGS